VPDGPQAARRLAPQRGTGPAGRPRLGRPPRIDRAAIAAAAADMPLEQITLRSVAERLGVSVPGLYHYVSGRADLLRLAAEQSAIRMTVPEDHGQHWAVWCFEWADYVRRVFVADPELLKEFVNGAFGVDRMAGPADMAIGVCARHGFSERAGFEAYQLISECALGAAISGIRAVHAAAEGQSPALEMRLLAHRDAAELPHLDRLGTAGALTPPSFADRMTTLLTGIAVRHGLAAQDIAGRVEAASQAAR
jgi:AcrR family transcriptional regulator